MSFSCSISNCIFKNFLYKQAAIRPSIATITVRVTISRAKVSIQVTISRVKVRVAIKVRGSRFRISRVRINSVRVMVKVEVYMVRVSSALGPLLKRSITISAMNRTS